MPGLRRRLRALFAPIHRANAPRLTLVSLEDRAVPATAVYTLVNAWNTGQQAEVAITNATGPAVSGWQVAFDYSGAITQIWNAKVVSQTGSHYVIGDLGWNASIPVGGNVTFGFLSSPSPTAANITLNGTPVGGTTPPPTLSITGGSATEGNPTTNPGPTSGFLSTQGNQIVDSTGATVKLSGVNWFGMETETFAPHGLWTRGYKSMMDQMKESGFNVIRLPFSSGALDPGRVPNGIDFSKNPDLAGLSPVQVMDKIVDYAGQIGLRIFLDHHRSSVGNGAGSGLWYESGSIYTDARWVSDWAMLASRFAGNPTVLGADLHNEPHGAATWGSGNLATDWRLAAERAGNAIHAVNPDWLIIVEGIESGPSGNYWWGGNLSSAGQYPVRLTQTGKLVYSPHDYPSTVYAQSWFSDPDYPNNLEEIWDKNWGYLFRQNIAPVLLGEFGTKLGTQSDRLWLDAITNYLGGDLDGNGTNDLPAGSQGMSWTFWSWNPNSGDTGGILSDDWNTVRTDKLDYLRPIQFGLLGGSTGSNPNLGGGTVSFTVRLSAASAVPVAVNYSTQGGTATSGTDFRATSGSLTFSPGETVKTILVPVIPDTQVEGIETFAVALSNPIGATFGTSSASGTIVDDDSTTPPPPPPPLPGLSVGNVSQNEGNAAGTLTFTIRLSAASTQTVTVNYTTQNGTATAGSDYLAKSGNVTFAPGETVKTVTVSIVGDTTVEANETFRLALSGATQATIATAIGTATLVNDDVPPPPPPPTSGSAPVAFSIGSNWGTGFIGTVAITNTGTGPWKNWTLEFDAGFEITNIWGAEIVSRIGTRYVVKAAAWNGVVAPGASVSFGFQAAKPAALNPVLGNLLLKPVL